MVTIILQIDRKNLKNEYKIQLKGSNLNGTSDLKSI